MANVEHEHTLNVWLAELLRRRGLNARQERKQANRRRIDVEIHVGNVKIALEAEQGQGSTKKRDAIGDADGRLRQRNADCAIAVCYPDGITARSQLEHSRVLWAIRAPNRRAPVNEVRWADADLDELVSVIKLAPMQLGNPDHAAAALSASLDAAVERLSENQKREIARALDLPSGKLTRLPPSTPTPLIEHRRSRWNQAAKRAMLVIATAVMFHSRLGNRTNKIPSYPHFSLDDLRKLVVPDFTTGDDAVARLAAAYDAYAEDMLLPLPQMDECATRKALDKAVCAALGIDSETVATIRRQLAAEPSVTGKRYAG